MDKFSLKIKNSALVMLCVLPIFLAISRAGADALLSLVAAAFLLRSFLDKDWNWLKQREIKLLILLWLYICLNSFFLSSHDIALRSLAWGRFVIFFAAVTTWLIASGRELEKIAKWNIVIIALILIDTYWQYVNGVSLTGQPFPHDSRLGGPMSNPNVGNLLLKVALPTFAVLVYLLKNENIWKKVIFSFLVIALIVLIPLTGERSISLLMIFSLAIICCLYFIFMPKLRKYVIASAAGFCGIMWYLVTTQRVVFARSKLLVEQVSDFADSVYGQLYKAAFVFWKGKPFFGIGIGEFKIRCPLEIDRIWPGSYCDNHPHNIYLELLSEAGFIGIALFILAMFFVFSRFVRNAKTPGIFMPFAIAFSGITILIWPIIVTQSIFSNWPAMIFWYSLALCVSLPKVAIKHER